MLDQILQQYKLTNAPPGPFYDPGISVTVIRTVLTPDAVARALFKSKRDAACQLSGVSGSHLLQALLVT